ncbi:MAG: RNA polymerase-binding protein DksA [Pseudomonadota bacterium]|nr:RNA polymerase-binding protein DksA [Pseudomonadota bacterium]
MNDAQLDHFRQVLNAWRSELVDETSRTVHHLQDETVHHPDPNDRASQETDMALELRNRDRDRKLVKKIDESILHLGSGDYGYCENCGEEIGLQRLEARPTAALCIDCKTLDEIREKQLS